jgi:phospholipase/carboxylesterase
MTPTAQDDFAMPGPFDLSGPSQPPLAGGRPKQLVVLLHGYGADGNDLIGLAPHFAQLLPDAEFISPHAPFPCEMAPYGRQWFSFSDRTPAAVLAGTRAAATMLDAFLDQALAERGLGGGDLALVGFSQGTMMSLFVALRRAVAPAAVVGYSGALVGADELAGEIRSRPPVLLIHGDADPVVPYSELARARTQLQAAGVPVTVETRPGLQHGIDERGLLLGGQFLARSFSVQSVVQ